MTTVTPRPLDTPARRAREAAILEIRARFDAERQAKAIAAAEVARARIEAAGGIKALDRKTYEKEWNETLRRLRSFR